MRFTQKSLYVLLGLAIVAWVAGGLMLGDDHKPVLPTAAPEWAGTPPTVGEWLGHACPDLYCAAAYLGDQQDVPKLHFAMQTTVHPTLPIVVITWGRFEGNTTLETEILRGPGAFDAANVMLKSFTVAEVPMLFRMEDQSYVITHYTTPVTPIGFRRAVKH